MASQTRDGLKGAHDAETDKDVAGRCLAAHCVRNLDMLAHPEREVRGDLAAPRR